MQDLIGQEGVTAQPDACMRASRRTRHADWNEMVGGRGVRVVSFVKVKHKIRVTGEYTKAQVPRR